jgi:oligopeptidase A
LIWWNLTQAKALDSIEFFVRRYIRVQVKLRFSLPATIKWFSLSVAIVVRACGTPLEEINTPLETTWGLAKTLYLGNKTLMPTKQYLTIHDRARRARATKFNSQAIYYAIKRQF